MNMRRDDLTVDVPLEEEDISDGSPYIPYISHSPASASTSSSISLTPTAARFPSSPAPPSTGSKLNLNLPPSPALGSPACSPAVSHLHVTLSRITPLESRLWKRQAELDALKITQETTEKLRRWIIGIAMIDFDLDDGPGIDGVYPALHLFPAEAENIAFCAFPDSLQFDQGSASHSFVVKEQLHSVHKRPPLKDGFIYGYSYFMQKRNPESKRGYDQTSVVILTQHQFPALFSSLISIFGPLYQQHGLPMLEAACHNIVAWCDLVPGTTVELGFLGNVLRVKLPNTADEQQFLEASSFMEKDNLEQHILASWPPLLPPPIFLFEAALPHLWSLWECLVLGEPLLVFGTSPTQTSQAIWWLRDLLRPIPLAGDIRPYFTIQDWDHATLVNRLPPKSGVILGVTNPFFEKSCSHWPHILSLGRQRLPATAKLSPGQCPAGPAPGWATRTHKRYISKDRALLKQLEAALLGDEKSRLDASLALRSHLCSRTTQLIAPLARYLNTLIPSPSEVMTPRPSGNTLRLKPFNSAHFFASLKAHGSTLPFRSSGKRTEFYDRWLKTPGFGLWLAQQERIVENVLKEKENLTRM